MGKSLWFVPTTTTEIDNKTQSREIMRCLEKKESQTGTGEQQKPTNNGCDAPHVTFFWCFCRQASRPASPPASKFAGTRRHAGTQASKPPSSTCHASHEIRGRQCRNGFASWHVISRLNVLRFLSFVAPEVGAIEGTGPQSGQVRLLFQALQERTVPESPVAARAQKALQSSGLRRSQLHHSARSMRSKKRTCTPWNTRSTGTQMQ